MGLQRVIGALFLVAAFSAQAEIPLTELDILGSWSVNKESINRDGSAYKELNTTWEFKSDGTMIGISIDSQKHARVGKFRAILKYRIEDRKLIKQVSPGRSKLARQIQGRNLHRHRKRWSQDGPEMQEYLFFHDQKMIS